jgi:sorting nexin-1/2
LLNEIKSITVNDEVA